MYLKEDGRRGFRLILSFLGGTRHVMVLIARRSNMRSNILINVYTHTAYMYIYIIIYFALCLWS